MISSISELFQPEVNVQGSDGVIKMFFFQTKAGQIIEVEAIRGNTKYFYKINQKLCLRIFQIQNFQVALEDQVQFFRFIKLFRSIWKKIVIVQVNAENHLSLKLSLKKQQTNQQQYISVHPYCIKQLQVQNCQSILALQIIDFILKGYRNSMMREQIINLIDKFDLSHNLSYIKQIFKGLFQFGGVQNQYDSNIFTQRRFQDASIKNILVFNPTMTTTQLFQIILKELGYHKTKFIHGQAGIGKSISIFLLWILSNFIISYQELYWSIYGNLPKLKPTIPKIFYYTIPQTAKSYYQSFKDVIESQLPIQLKRRITKHFMIWQNPYQLIKTILKQIKMFYSTLGLQVVYVIDQINIYYSKIRMVENVKQYQKSIAQITLILKQLQQYQVVFNSSQNIEAGLLKKDFKTNFYDIKNPKNGFTILQYKLNHEQRSIIQKGVVQKINIMKFQFLKQIVKKCQQNKFQWFEFIKNIFQQIVKYKSHYSKYFTQITHHHISNFIETLNITQIFNNLQDSSQFHQQFQIFLQNLNQNIFSILSQKYYQFVMKQDDQINKKRISLLLNLRQSAFQQKHQKQSQPYFIVKYDRQFHNFLYLNQQSTLIIKDKQGVKQKIKIFYKPTTFLQITDFIIKKDVFTQTIKQLLYPYSDIPTWFGQTFDRCLTKLFVEQKQVVFFLGNNQIHIKTIENQKNWSCISKQNYDNGIYQRLSPLFRILENHQANFAPNNYICALPVTKNLQTSYTSQKIDCMLIKMVSNKKYHLHTIDFCVSFEFAYIKKKIVSAQKFFENFAQIYQKQKHFKDNSQKNPQDQIFYKRRMPEKKMDIESQYQLLIDHWIIIPQFAYQKSNHLIFQKKKYNNFININFTTLERLNINVDKNVTNKPQMDMKTWLYQELKKKSQKNK